MGDVRKRELSNQELSVNKEWLRETGMRIESSSGTVVLFADKFSVLVIRASVNSGWGAREERARGRLPGREGFKVARYGAARKRSALILLITR